MKLTTLLGYIALAIVALLFLHILGSGEPLPTSFLWKAILAVQLFTHTGAYLLHDDLVEQEHPGQVPLAARRVVHAFFTSSYATSASIGYLGLYLQHNGDKAAFLLFPLAGLHMMLSAKYIHYALDSSASLLKHFGKPFLKDALDGISNPVDPEPDL